MAKRTNPFWTILSVVLIVALVACGFAFKTEIKALFSGQKLYTKSQYDDAYNQGKKSGEAESKYNYELANGYKLEIEKKKQEQMEKEQELKQKKEREQQEMEIQRKKEQKKHIKEMIVQRAYERKQAQLLKAHNKRQFPYQYKDKNPYYKYDFYIGRISIKSTKAHPNKYSTQQSYYYSFYFIFCIHFSFSIYSTRLLGLSS